MFLRHSVGLKTPKKLIFYTFYFLLPLGGSIHKRRHFLLAVKTIHMLCVTRFPWSDFKLCLVENLFLETIHVEPNRTLNQTCGSLVTQNVVYGCSPCRKRNLPFSLHIVKQAQTQSQTLTFFFSLVFLFFFFTKAQNKRTAAAYKTWKTLCDEHRVC